MMLWIRASNEGLSRRYRAGGLPVHGSYGKQGAPNACHIADKLHKDGDAVIAAITSVIRVRLKSSELFIDVSKPDARAAGLLSDSIVDC